MDLIELILALVVLVGILVIIIMIPFGLSFILFGFIAYHYLHMTGMVWWAATLLFSLMFSAIFYSIWNT